MSLSPAQNEMQGCLSGSFCKFGRHSFTGFQWEAEWDLVGVLKVQEKGALNFYIRENFNAIAYVEKSTWGFDRRTRGQIEQGKASESGI